MRRPPTELSQKPTLFFYCQHSLGMGHFIRSVTLAEHLAESFEVVFMNGGPLPAGIVFPAEVERVDLPPLVMESDGGLRSIDPAFTVDAALTRRRDLMLALLEERRPRTLLIEFFPFGRRKFEPELLPLLDAARALGERCPHIVCSVRDLLVTARPSQQRFDDRAQALCDRYFDLVLVHADPTFAALEDSFEPTHPLAVPVRYTGFLSHSEPTASDVETREGVVISAGGGMVGESLFRAAVHAHRLNWPTLGVQTTIVAGPFAPAHVLADLRAEARCTEGLTVVSHVPDLRGLLRRARCSVSQCGYNTMLDIVGTGVPSLVVPFSEGRENEQTRRAQRLAERQAVRWLDARELTAARLAEEIRLLLDFQPRPLPFLVDGASVSAQIITALETAHARV